MDLMLWSVKAETRNLSAQQNFQGCLVQSTVTFCFHFFPSSLGKEEEHRQVVFPTVSNIGYHGSLLRKRKNTHTSSLMHPVLPFGQSS